MGGRRRFLRTTLAALAAVVLLGGIGAGVWVAASDEDEPDTVFVAGPEADPAEDAEPPAPEAETAPSPTETEPPESPQPSAPESPSARGDSQSDRTRFPRERREDPDRRGKSFSVPPAHEFTGTGNALIGTVDVRKPALVRWRARGRFGLEFGQEAFPIVAPSRSGQLVVPPYRFELVRVLAKGPWTITVTPQG